MANKDITLKRKTASGTDTLNPTTTWSQVNDKPTTFAPTAHTHDVDDINASGTASNTTYLRGDGAWVSLSSSSGLTFKGTIDLSGIGGKNGDGLATAGLTSPGDYLIVSATGVINNDGTPLVTLTVQTPGDEGDASLPVTLETGDWILYESASGTTVNLTLINNNDASKAPLVHTHDDRYYTETESDSRFVNTTGDTMTGALSTSTYLEASQGVASWNGTLNIDSDYLDRLWATSIGTETNRGTKPANYYHYVNLPSNGTSRGLQLAGYYGGNNALYVRTKTDSGNAWLGWERLFSDNYHPNADKWTTARTLSLTGAVTGSVSWDGSGNASLATTATADPTLTINGDASGSATFTNLGNATLTLTVNDDSHNHIISNVDGLQTALDGKAASSHTHSQYVEKNVGYEWTGTGGSALSFRSLDTIDTASGDQAALEVYQDTPGADAFMQFHISSDYAKYFGLHGGINDFVIGGWSHGASYQRIYHDGYRPYADEAGRAYPKRVGNVDLNFNWSGQSGQPPWLWGGSDGSNMYVYNPSNFSVNYANTSGWADQVDVNTSTSTSLFNILWHSGDTVYGSNGLLTIKPSTGELTSSGAIKTQDHFYGKDGAGYSNIYRIGGLYLSWDNNTYGTQSNHSLRSTYGDSYGDHITLNSYGHIRMNIDSNNNGSNNFEVGGHTTGTANTYFRITDTGSSSFFGDVSTTGNLTVGGTITANGLTLSNDNILGVNQLSINDPGEGILWQGTTNVNQIIVDDASDNIMDFQNLAKMRIGGNPVPWVKTQGTTFQQGLNFTISGSTLYISTSLT